MDECIGRRALKVNVGKTKMMVSGTEGGIALSKINPCDICGKKVGSSKSEDGQK